MQRDVLWLHEIAGMLCIVWKRTHLVNELLESRQFHASFIEILAVLDVLVQDRLDIERCSVSILLHSVDSANGEAPAITTTACVLLQSRCQHCPANCFRQGVMSLQVRGCSSTWSTPVGLKCGRNGDYATAVKAVSLPLRDARRWRRPKP